MSKHCRVIIQTYETSNSKNILKESLAFDHEVSIPTNCLDISIGLKNQLEIIRKVQDHIVSDKMELVAEKQGDCCPKCQNKLNQAGKQDSPLHDVLTDHTVLIQRVRCLKCGFKTPSTVNQLIGTTMTGELTKIQAELGAKHTFREAEDLLDLFSNSERKINNHDRVKKSTEALGNTVAVMKNQEKEIIETEAAKELVINVDGGHINTTEEGKRSMEAMTAVIYKPEAIIPNSKNTRNKLSSKNCAASVRDDNQEQIICATIIAALKQGLDKNTHVTALCDGAKNCWSVVDAIKPLCGSTTYILDWFHIAMKMQNISFADKLKNKFMRVKWHLWRGNTQNALTRIQQLKDTVKSTKEMNKLTKFETYIINNADRIVNYRKRQQDKLVFTSNLAESTVESLINRRCKGHQHMQWSRDGLEPVLQIRAAINSKGEWGNIWRTAVLNAA